MARGWRFIMRVGRVVADCWAEDRDGCDEVDFKSKLTVLNSYPN